MRKVKRKAKIFFVALILLVIVMRLNIKVIESFADSDDLVGFDDWDSGEVIDSGDEFTEPCNLTPPPEPEPPSDSGSDGTPGYSYERCACGCLNYNPTCQCSGCDKCPTETIYVPGIGPTRPGDPNYPGNGNNEDDKDDDEEEEKEETPPPHVVTPIVKTSILSVSGNAFESLEQMRNLVKGNVFDGGTAASVQLSTDTVKSASDISIEGIKVELLDENQNVIQTTYTDADGNYSFNVDKTVSYYLRFSYGVYDEETETYLNTKDSALKPKYVKNALKYNAQDYSAIQIGNNKSNYAKTTDRTYMGNKNEIIIALDYSVSMTNNGRFDTIRDSAIDLVRKIYKEYPEVYVGLILFSAKADVVVPLQENADELIEELKKYRIEGNRIKKDDTIMTSGNTNIGAVLQKAKSAFLSNESAHTIILLTDGVPSTHNKRTVQLYQGYTAKEYQDYMKNIADCTKQDLDTIAKSEKDDEESGKARLITVIASDDLEKSDIKSRIDTAAYDRIFEKVMNTTYRINDKEETINKILKENVFMYIDIVDKEITNYNGKTWEVGENSERRAEIDAQYNVFNNQQKLTGNTTYSQMFYIIDRLKGNVTEDSKLVNDVLQKPYDDFVQDETKNFAKKNDMVLETVGPYNFVKYTTRFETITEGKGEEAKEVEYCIVSDGVKEEKYNTYDYKVTVEQDVFSAQNLVLIERERVLNHLEKRISGVKLMLSDGTVLVNRVAENAENTRDNMQNREIANIRDVSNFPGKMLLQLDREIIHGATLQIEYTLVVKNESNEKVKTTSFSVIDYYDKSFNFNPEAGLLSEDGKNSDYGWRIITGDELKEQGYLSENNPIESEKEYIFAEYNTNTQSLVTMPIGSSGERYVKLVLSQTLTPEMMQQDYKTFNQAEIISYSNDLNRRSNYLEPIAHLNSYIEDAYDGIKSKRFMEQSELINFINKNKATLEFSTLDSTKDLLYAIYKKLPNNYNDFIKSFYATNLLVHDTPGNYEVDSLWRDELDVALSIPLSITPPTGLEQNE